MKRAKKDIDFWYNLKIYFSFLKNYKAIFIFLIIIALLLEANSTIEKYLFRSIIDNGTSYGAGLLSSQELSSKLYFVGLIFLGLVVTRVFLRWLEPTLIHKLEGNLIFDVKRRFFAHLLQLSHNFHITHKTGSLISRIGRGSSAMERMTDFFIFNTAPILFQLIIISVTVSYFDKISSIVILLTAFLFTTYSIIVQQLQRPASLEHIRADDIEKANISDVFTNIDSIKYYGKERYINLKYKWVSDYTKKSLLKDWSYYSWLGLGNSLILVIGTFFTVYFPLMKFLAGDMTLGTLVLIYTLYVGIIGHLHNFMSGVRGLYRSMADFQDLFQYAKIENEIKDKDNAVNLEIKSGVIEFKDLKFNYGKRNIFNNFNLKINKNEKIALVGHSGSGKSTLIKLLYRLYDLDSGKILIDGKDITDFKQESLRSELSIVPQECVLFDDTIYNNILFSNPTAKRNEVISAIKFAQLDKIIEKFPNKENTIVGQRGVKLSGGEKQRVSIARAILADKKVLVLDEATSSLDSQTEHDIQKDLHRLLENRTSIIIAHRLSTIMSADKIIVLEKGKIVQIGNHRTLIKQPGLYRKLWNLQKGGYIGE
ncbi:MAG: ABC transporter ATP-binding protein [Nanoarchaeota archaeon]|nr:ABC transporter ATP-binding protein [Nanoarchaeota archaeon]